MSFDKSFFKQFNNSIRKEAQKFKAKSEYKKLKFRKCNHKKAIITDRELRCPCGATWTGPKLIELYKLFGGKYVKGNTKKS